jgi:hypothetical protein
MSVQDLQDCSMAIDEKYKQESRGLSFVMLNIAQYGVALAKKDKKNTGEINKITKQIINDLLTDKQVLTKEKEERLKQLNEKYYKKWKGAL